MPGASASGAGGPRFKSGRPDWLSRTPLQRKPVAGAFSVPVAVVLPRAPAPSPARNFFTWEIAGRRFASVKLPANPAAGPSTRQAIIRPDPVDWRVERSSHVQGTAPRYSAAVLTT